MKDRGSSPDGTVSKAQGGWCWSPLPFSLRRRSRWRLEATVPLGLESGREALGKRSIPVMSPETVGFSGRAPRPPERTATSTIPQTPRGVPDATSGRGDVYNGFKYRALGVRF